MESATIERRIKIASIILMLFVFEILVIIGFFLFVAGALTNQPVGSFFAFVLMVISGCMIRCLLDFLVDAIDE
jgi:carbon starvation protein CstA